jgi:hypothetical protein
VHPDASRYGGRSSSSGGASGGAGKSGGVWNAMIQRLTQAIEQLHSMPAGEVVMKAAKTHPQAFGEGVKGAMAKDARVTEWMTRRVNGQ